MLDKNSEEYWDSLLESEGLGNIDNEEGIHFIKNTSDNIRDILDLDIKENFDSESFSLYNNSILLGIIKYNSLDGDIYIDFLGNVNGNLKNIIADNEFRNQFDSYFNNIDLFIKGLGRELFKRFINKFKEGTNLSFISVEGSEGFYTKIIEELEGEGLISLISKKPEYKMIIL